MCASPPLSSAGERPVAAVGCLGQTSVGEGEE